MASTKPKKIERVVIKIPAEVAEYLRSEFPHGKRSEFLKDCILRHKHETQVKEMERRLRYAAKKRVK